MKLKLLDNTEINFPSGANIEAHEENLYLASGDSRHVLILDKYWKEIERINITDEEETGISKASESDFKATTIFEINKIPRMLILGAQTNEPHKSTAVLFNLDDRTQEDFDVDVFYDRVKAVESNEVNIEAASVVLGQLVLAHRGSVANPVNNLVITDLDVWKNQAEEEITIRPFEFPETFEGFAEISGMCYSPVNDWLIITLFTEVATEEGSDEKVFESYIGMIENAARKLIRKKIKINELVNLADVDKRFRGQKIESICIQSDKDRKLKLHLVAEQGGEQLTLFKLRLKE